MLSVAQKLIDHIGGCCTLLTINYHLHIYLIYEAFVIFNIKFIIKKKYILVSLLLAGIEHFMSEPGANMLAEPSVAEGCCEARQMQRQPQANKQTFL